MPMATTNKNENWDSLPNENGNNSQLMSLKYVYIKSDFYSTFQELLPHEIGNKSFNELFHWELFPATVICDVTLHVTWHHGGTAAPHDIMPGILLIRNMQILFRSASYFWWRPSFSLRQSLFPLPLTQSISLLASFSRRCCDNNSTT